MTRRVAFASLVFFSLSLLFCANSLLIADQIFYDNFESEAFTNDAWEQGAEPLDWEISNDYNHFTGDQKCLKIFAEQMEVWGDMWY